MNSQEIANAIMDIEQKNYPYYLVSEIKITELVECDFESWHMTYVLTNFAKMLLEKSI